jgi:hypothetical protein
MALHNASTPGFAAFTVTNSRFESNDGDAISLDAAEMSLSNTYFTTETDLQGKAVALVNGAAVSSTNVQIDRFSEFDLGSKRDTATFLHCKVENGIDKHQPFISMQRSCTFDASVPGKVSCEDTDESTVFNGPVVVENQVFLQFFISSDTPPLGLVTVPSGITFNITGAEPECRDDPTGTLAKFAVTDPSGTQNIAPLPDEYCGWLKGTIQKFKRDQTGDQSPLDCNETLEEVNNRNAGISHWFKGLFTIDSDLYNAPPYDDDVRRNEYANVRLEQVCRGTCGKCDGFTAQQHPADADIQPRLLVDAVFDVQKSGKLSLHNIAIRDGYNLGPSPSFVDLGDPTADPPIFPPDSTPTTGPSYCGECPDPSQPTSYTPTAPGAPQPFTPNSCPACDPSEDGAGRPMPAVNLQPGAYLEASFSQLANPRRPEWGWLVRSCNFQQRTGDMQNAHRQTDICGADNLPTDKEQTGGFSDTEHVTIDTGNWPEFGGGWC